MYPSESCVFAELSVDSELYEDLKFAVTRSARELRHIDIVIGSSRLSEEELREQMKPKDRYTEAEHFDVDELSIIINHPVETETHDRMMRESDALIADAKRLNALLE